MEGDTKFKKNIGHGTPFRSPLT